MAGDAAAADKFKDTLVWATQTNDACLARARNRRRTSESRNTETRLLVPEQPSVSRNRTRRRQTNDNSIQQLLRACSRSL